jgi:hypothetical protein
MTSSVQARPQTPADPNAGTKPAEPDVMKQPPPPGVNGLAWKLSDAAERHQMLKDQAAPAQAPSAPAQPSTALREMAKTGPAAGQAAPPGRTPSLKETVAGTQPKQGVDVQMALMANDAYNSPTGGPNGGAQVENPVNNRALNGAGWNRLVPQGDHMLNPATGKSVAVDPKLLEDSASGFSASIYQNRSGQTVVAFAGTNPKEFGDVKADLGQGADVTTTQYNRAALVAHQVQGIAGAGNVAFTGHSLGGGLAATAALATGETAVTFNAAGPSNDTIRQVTGQNPNDVRQAYGGNGMVRSYSVAGDLLTTAGAGGAPPQLGSKWYTPITQDGVSVADPRDLITLHGGGGDNQLYIDGLKTGNIKPGFVPNPYVAAALNSLPGLGPMSPMDRNTVLNLAGNVADAARNQKLDERQVANQALTDVATALRQPDAFTPTRVSGALVNAGLDLAGRSAKNGLNFVGNEVTTLTDGAGADIRGWGRVLGFDPASVDRAASKVENAGNTVSKALATGGGFISKAADHAGNAAAWVADRSASAQKAVVSAAARASRWVQKQEVRAATAVGHAVVNTGRWVAKQEVRAATAVGHALVNTGRAVVNTGRAVLQQEERAAVAVGNAALNTGRAVVTQEARAAAWAGQQVQNGARAAGNWVQDRANDAKKWFGGLF